ncbi:MAG: hypothetical protein KDB22_28570 [Planctomycetales bacterium]|nr:hypothetical protein [Planctomycetales bacterium]
MHDQTVSKLRIHLCVLAVWLLCSVSRSSLAQSVALGEESLRKAATWQWPDVGLYEEMLLSYMEQRQLSEVQREQIVGFWESTREQLRGPAFLDRLLQAAAMIEPRLGEINDRLYSLEGPAVAPGEFDWLTSDVPGWMQDTIRLACGRAFGQRKMYDECLETLASLSENQVCDPSTLIFYRSASEHHLMQKEPCLADIDRLLERASELPVRYATLAKLMKSDIQPMEPDSLDEISRMMRDVQRRLVLGRAGEKVRTEEQEIVDKLDKMIEKIEQQLQQSSSQNSQGGSGGKQPLGAPMDSSQAAGGIGEGKVDNKEIGERSGWGNLPPAQRQQALQQLTEELPSHYRDVIEGYFRQLAKDKP